MSYPTRGQHPQGCLNLAHSVHHTSPELLHHQYQPQGFHGHASTINTSDGSHTLFEHEHQIAGPAGGPTEKHQHPRKVKPEDKSGHPAHRGHVDPAMYV
ncbi:hypothetical protein N7520_003768 [Penicillium odoratum]|uniref:uncharacterized protein n=1 Tax=Penicillium odoratum TaxID=1167516 RepID=UPI0025482A8E|nr:uncharacterized protein N7520_003768 [Penicillium odoratum]KAJ5769209.1 hypothetical protein N7520_003768 [Penicillium odoratum]